MKKNFLLLFLMALLPLAGWAEDISTASVAVGDVEYGTTSIGTPMVVWQGETLTSITHYTLDTKYYKEVDGDKVVAGTTLATLPVGTYYVKVTGVPENGFNGEAYGEFKVTKATLIITVTMDPASPSKVYDGTTANPSTVSIHSWSGYGYKNSDTDDVVSGTLTWSYSNANVGNQPITFTGLTAENYKITYSVKTIEITAKPLAAGMVTAKNFTVDYKGAAYTPNTDFAVTVMDGSTTLTQGTDYAVKVYSDEEMSTEVSPRNQGTYYVGVVGATSTNYGGGPIAVGTLTINKANLTVLANNQSADYDGVSTVNSNFDDDDYQYIGLVGEDAASAITGTTLSIAAADLAKKDAGDYTITASGSMNDNYNIYFQPGKFTIKKVDLTITAQDKEMTLGGAEPEYTIVINGAVAGEETTMRGTGDGEGKAKAERDDDDDTIGEHDIIVSYDEDADVFKNYNVTPVNGILTINGGTIVVTVKPQTIAYGDDETWSEPQEGRDYFVNGIAEADKSKLTVTLTRANASTKTPGTYAITASANKVDGYSETITYVNSTLTITKRELQVTALPQTLAVGQKVSALDITQIEFADDHGMAPGEDPADVLELAFATSVDVDGTTKALTTAGTYINGIEVKLIDGTNDCYTLTPTAGNLIVGTALVLNRPNKAAYEADNAADDAAAVIAAADGQTVSVEFSDFAMVKEKWYPIVLPFATSVKEISEALGYAVVNILNESNTDPTKITFKLHMGDIPANTPFVVKNYANVNLKDVTIPGKEIVNSADPSVSDGSDVKFIGSYSHKQGFAANEAFFSVSADKNNYYWGSESNTTYSAPLSAYFQIPEGSPARTIEFQEADGTVTAIKAVAADFNGKNAEGWYTIGGIKLQAAPTEKGVYIKDGKKFVIK